MSGSRPYLLLLPVLLLPACAPQRVVQAVPPAAAAVTDGLVLGVRDLATGERCAPVLTALVAAHGTPPVAPGAAPAAEVMLRIDDGRLLTLVERPRTGLKPLARIRLVMGNGTVSIEH